MKVQVPPTLSHLTGDSIVIEVVGSTVGMCVSDLVRRFPRLKAELFGGDGKLEKNVEVYVNLKSTYPEGLGTKVKEGDEIEIVVMLAGG
jgi:molybdopterin synthase sulfur carrier subunit